MEKIDELNIVCGPETCPGKIEIPTDKETSILSRMKEIKEKVRNIKSQLNQSESSEEEKGTGGLSDLEEELAILREKWESLDKERLAAARERMIILGHEEGP